MDDADEWTRRAIDVMTAWSDHTDGKKFAADRVAAYIGAEADGAVTLTVGFINLAAILLISFTLFSGLVAPRVPRPKKAVRAANQPVELPRLVEPLAS